MQKLIDRAIKARETAYAPYSKFFVGAAILLSDGTVLTGSNVENASFSLCNCAERGVLFTAYNNGYRKKDILAFAVAGDTNKPISPCGACRQVMNELIEKTTPIYLTNLKGDVLQTTIEELLPFSFDDIENV